MKILKMKKKISIIPLVFLCGLFVIASNAVVNGGSGSPPAVPYEKELAIVTTEVTPLIVDGINVAVPQGSAWTNEVVDYLNTLPDKTATPIPPDAPYSTLQNYDALVVYGNVTVDGDAVLQWVNEGGRLVITPWSLTNDFVPSIGFTSAEPSLPAYNPHYQDHGLTDVYGNNPLNLNLLLPNHCMVKDVQFNSNSVGYERGSVSKGDATEIATWNDAYDSAAIVCWKYGDGVVVYLNMHYITSDCDRAIWYDWGKQLLANAIQIPCECEIEVAVDIKPGSCPNPLNVESKGVLPVAILGSADFDVHDIDVASIQLAGVAPIRSSLEDVATPVDGEECECTTEAGDGITDLMLKFGTEDIADALGEVVNGEVLELTLTGELLDGTPIEGADCIRVKKPINK